jgi:hypothetical protein
VESVLDIQLLKERLDQVAQWCSLKSSMADPTNSLRTPELKPNEWLKFGDEGFEGVGSLETVRQRQIIVDTVNKRRADLLSRARVVTKDISNKPRNGRFLLYVPDESLRDCGSAEQSHGFFDCWDAPPWDTWMVYLPSEIRFEKSKGLWYSSSCLISWVPKSFVGLAEKGIVTNLGDCLRWADSINSQSVWLLSSLQRSFEA